MGEGKAKPFLDLRNAISERRQLSAGWNVPDLCQPKPVEEPSTWGFVVIFDHEPTAEDWEMLKRDFSQGFGGEAQTYTGQEHAYFAVSTGTTPDDLKMVEGIEETREVYFFTDEDGPGIFTPADSASPEDSDPNEGGRADVPELLRSRRYCSCRPSGGRLAN